MKSQSGEGPLAAYRARLAAGLLKPDPVQALAAEKLESLHRALRGYEPGLEAGWRARLGLARRPDPAPHGLYIFGGVGRGKSMLMDLFFATAPVERKRRVHFNAFMLEIHDQLYMGVKASAPRAGVHPMMPLVTRLAEEAWLLCWDEFQVTNIADAMILKRLLEALFERGVVIVATSNLAPDDLYAGGLQRERFLPTIALIQERLDLLELDGGVDYRRELIKTKPVYYAPLGPQASATLEGLFLSLTEGEAGGPAKLRVQGRELVIPRAAGTVAMAHFADLCERPLGPADFVTLATHFEALVLDGVRRMTAAERDAPRRFMTLIDELYEHRVKLVCAADAAPEALYAEGEHAAAFQRTASRLHEMQSADYLASPHLT